MPIVARKSLRRKAEKLSKRWKTLVFPAKLWYTASVWVCHRFSHGEDMIQARRSIVTACAVKEGFDVKEWTLLCGLKAALILCDAREKCRLTEAAGR